MKPASGTRNNTILRKAIFPLLFLFLSFGDWHVHADSVHPCDTTHSAVNSDMKWHPHGTCEETEANVTHDDLSGVLIASKFDQLDTYNVVNTILSSPDGVIHLENGHDCQTPLIMHCDLVHTTVLLI